MKLHLLAEAWSDALALSGFVLTLVGFVVTLVSLYYAIRQVKEAKSAAEAARAAATATLEESRRDYLRYIASNSQRFVSEVIIHVGNRAWEMAGLRLDDLADQVAQLTLVDPLCEHLAAELRDWAGTAKRLATGKLSRFAESKWGEFLLRLRSKLDSHHGPFRAQD